MGAIRAVCVYCGSSPGVRPEYRAAAAGFGELLARRGVTLVYGGAAVGLMGAVADAALGAGGEVIGVLPRHLATREVAHQSLTRLELVATMHERKARMAELADAFVALPGGIGTLEELFETWTWAQLGLHRKPCGLLDVAGYFAPLAAFLDRMLGEGFVRPEHRAMLVSATDPAALLDALSGYQGPALPKWLTAADLAPRGR
jgi:uncharacterized protein (TIGR00730 family)